MRRRSGKIGMSGGKPRSVGDGKDRPLRRCAHGQGGPRPRQRPAQPWILHRLEGAYYNGAGRVVAGPGTFMFNAPGPFMAASPAT